MMEQGQYYKLKLEYEIDSWDLNEAIKKGENIIIVDARSREAYDREHILKAINIPHREMDLITTEDLDKSALIVTYCDGIGCNASTKGAYKMHQLNFRVIELIGGLDWWKRDGYSTTRNIIDEVSTKLMDSGQCGC